MSTSEIKQLRDRARQHGIEELVRACEVELDVRGTIEFDSSRAQKHADWALLTESFDLPAAVFAAFSQLPMNDEESLLTVAIASKPGISFQELQRLRGKGDVGLIMGHIVYERYGFFRKFINPKIKMSDLLFERQLTEAGTTYKIQDNILEIFKKLNIISK
jgi:hypothetical protein